MNNYINFKTWQFAFFDISERSTTNNTTQKQNMFYFKLLRLHTDCFWVLPLGQTKTDFICSYFFMVIVTSTSPLAKNKSVSERCAPS